MALTNEQLVHQMYIAYYQRPADPAGVQHWVSLLEERGSWEAVAADFGNPGNPEYAALYGNMDREGLVAELYKSVFGREAAQGEIDFWANTEHSDQNLGFAIINGAQNADLELVQNKAKFAELLAAAVTQEEYMALVEQEALPLLDAITAETDVTPEYVADALAAAGGETAALTQALQAYQAAVETEEAQLKGLASNEGFLAALNDNVRAEAIKKAKTAETADIDDAVVNVANGLDAAVLNVTGATIFSGANLVGQNTLAGIIADAKKEAADDVADAQKALTAADAKVTAAEKTSLNNLTKRAEAAVIAENGVEAAITETDRQEGIANANLGAANVAGTADTFVAPNATTGVIELNAAGKDLTAAQQAHLTPYLVALNAEVKAEDAQEAAIEALIQALEKVGITATGTTVAAVQTASGDAFDYNVAADGRVTVELDAAVVGATDADIAGFVTAQQDLIEAQTQQAELDKAVAAFESINAIAAEAKRLADDVEDKGEAITDSEEDGGLGITLVDATGGVGVFDAVDLFVYAGKDATLSFFETGDFLFFGKDYAFVELGASVDVAKERLGDAGVLEIFYQTQGNNVVFYVEKDAESGRELSDANLVDVTLSGVTDFEFNGDFVVVA